MVIVVDLQKDKYIIVEIIPTHSQNKKGLGNYYIAIIPKVYSSYNVKTFSIQPFNNTKL